MLQRAVNFCMGAVTVEVESAFPERILNLCGAHGIPFWDLTWRSPVCFTVTMTRKSWRRLRQQAERLDARLTVEGREGLPYLALRLRRRTVLLAGLAACILLFFYSTFFIWDFAIEGNVTVSDEEILRSLRKNGVTLGTFAYSFRSDDLRNHVLLDIPELSYIAVNVSGCRANVQVRERTAVPEDVDKRKPGNTVAVRDGLVTDIRPYDGEKLVLPGTTVQEGQLLISGVVDDVQAGTRFLMGRGKVYARTWYQLRCKVPGEKEAKAYTGEEKTVFALCWGTKRVNLYNSSSIDREDCDKITVRTQLTLPGGIVLPVTVVKETYRYYETETVERTQEEAEELASQVLKKTLLSGMDEGLVEEERYSSVVWEGGYLVELAAECHEQIGRFVEIPTEEQE